MEIVFITPWYGMFAGGLEVEFRCYAETLAQTGFNVEVLTTCSQSPYHSWQEDYFTPGTEIQNGVTIRRFRTNKQDWDKYLRAVHSEHQNPDTTTQYDFFTYGISSNDLIDYINQYDSKTILVCGPYFQALSYLTLTAHPQRIYLRVALHNEPQASWQPVADMLNAAKGYLFATDAEKELAIYFHGDRLGKKIIETPIIGVPTRMPALTTSTQNHHSILKQLPTEYCLYIGRKEAGKGINVLITWYQHYLKQCQHKEQSPLPLVFLGGGDRSLIPNSTHFIDLGIVSEEDKYAIIARALCLINLSNNESFSLVLMEAWSQNIPTLVSDDCAVTKQHCQKSGGGFSVCSADELQHAILKLKYDSTLRETMGQAGRAYLLNHYSLGQVIHRFLHLTQSTDFSHEILHENLN